MTLGLWSYIAPVTGSTVKPAAPEIPSASQAVAFPPWSPHAELMRAIGKPTVGAKFTQYEPLMPRSSSTCCFFMPLFSMLMWQASALRGMVRRAGVVPVAEMLPAQLIVAFAPDGFESTTITSLGPRVMLAQDDRRQPIKTKAAERITISPAQPDLS